MPQSNSNKAALGWLWRQSRPARKWLLTVITLGLAGGLLIIAQAWLISRIVHHTFMQGPGPDRSGPLFAALIAVIGLKAVTAWGREIAGFQAGAAVRGQVRRDLMAHLAAVGPVGISPLPSGRLVSSALEQVEALHNFVARYVPQLALAALLPLVILVYVFPISWAAGAVLLVTAPLIPVFMILIGMGAESISQRHFQALARMSAHFLDVLRGLTTLKLFGQSKAQAARIESVSRQYRLRTMAVLRVAFLSSAVLEFFSAIAIALVAVYLGMNYLGYLDFGDYGRPINFAAGFFILLLAPDFFLPLRELGTHYHARADAVGAAEQILKVFDLQPSAARAVQGRTALTAFETIRFDSVSVHYGTPSRSGIDDISFTLKRGEQVAVVGASGAGKSTLIHLLLGFIRPSSGRILIDGVPLDNLAQDDWRRQTAWIGQNPMLFSGTIRENIALARPDAGDGTIETAARYAGVLEFAQKRDSGLLTEVGEQGKALSMGQAQRVALARAFLKDAPLLLLDEPTASLDTDTEAGILTDLSHWGRGRTVLMATHRPAPLALMDRVIILEQGRLVAQASYAELKKTHGELLPEARSASAHNKPHET
jgi:ATP-binding cassette subfamily C protein CydD